MGLLMIIGVLRWFRALRKLSGLPVVNVVIQKFGAALYTPTGCGMH
jgi:hypothetical protein